MKVIGTLSFVIFYLADYALAQEDNIAIRALLSPGHSVRGNTCSSSEWATIVKTIERHTNGRSLRRANRVLYPSYCEACCSGFSTGWCMLVYGACAGYVPQPARRALVEISDSTAIEEVASPSTIQESSVVPGLRELSSSHSQCQSTIAAINSSLNGIYRNLSSSCRTVVADSRQFTCYAVTDLDIVGFKLWNGGTDRIVDNNFKGRRNERVCSSMTVNFEAVVGGLVNEVAFSTVGNNGFKSSNTETGGPFMSYGDNNKGNIYGKKLRVGTYTLVATPDGDSSKAKTLKFQVSDC